MEFAFSEPGEEPITLEAFFPALPQKVFAAWTEPDQVKKWFGRSPNSLIAAEIDLRVGGRWQFVKSMDDEKAVSFQGEYLEIISDRKLVFTWQHVVEFLNGQRDQTAASRVEVTFTAHGSGTILSLIHSGIVEEDARKGVGGGWKAAFTHLADQLPLQTTE